MLNDFYVHTRARTDAHEPIYWSTKWVAVKLCDCTDLLFQNSQEPFIGYLNVFVNLFIEKCPDQRYSFIPSLGICIHVNITMVTWHEAQEQCQRENTNLYQAQNARAALLDWLLIKYIPGQYKSWTFYFERILQDYGSRLLLLLCTSIHCIIAMSYSAENNSLI